MKNIKKIILLVLSMVNGSLSLAIVLEPNTITNNTGIPVTIDVTRHLKCLGSNTQTMNLSTTIGARQTGKIYVKSGAQFNCASNVTELKAEALGYIPAILENPSAKDYTVSIQIVPPPFVPFQGRMPIVPPTSVSIRKKLVIE